MVSDTLNNTPFYNLSMLRSWDMAVLQQAEQVSTVFLPIKQANDCDAFLFIDNVFLQWGSKNLQISKVYFNRWIFRNIF